MNRDTCIHGVHVELPCDKCRADADAAMERDVRVWNARMVELTAQMDALHTIVEPNPESRLLRAVWDMAAEYTRALERAHGVHDDLSHWWLECDLGNWEAGEAEVNGKWYPLTTIDELIVYLRETRHV